MAHNYAKQLRNEFYFCHRCEEYRKERDVLLDWCCDLCGNPIAIYGEADGVQISLSRKHASELARGDAFLFPHQMALPGNRVKTAATVGNMVELWLDGHGYKVVIASDKFVNVRNGGAWPKGLQMPVDEEDD